VARSNIVVQYEEAKGVKMPEKETMERAKKDKREGKAASTQAGEFVREAIEHVRQANTAPAHPSK
jgi:hypothetical protein